MLNCAGSIPVARSILCLMPKWFEARGCNPRLIRFESGQALHQARVANWNSSGIQNPVPVGFAGSSPATSTIYALEAHLAEQRLGKAKVVGSIPTLGSIPTSNYRSM